MSTTSEAATIEVTHLCPVPFTEGGDGTMPCCGRTPFEVPRYHRITLDPALVTCKEKPCGGTSFASSI